MHPAYSVIVFTCASGAGYGLLSWLAVRVAADGVADDVRLVGFGLALVLITVGLLSSTAHLGRPERAWRAFSQWRTSWLSREGVMAIATYVASGLLLLGLYGRETSLPLLQLFAVLTAGCAMATVWCTGMIYGSLATIRAWSHGLVSPMYVLLALATGRLLLNGVDGVGGADIPVVAVWSSLILLLAAWITKTIYWSAIDDARRSHTIGDATGLGRFGRVRSLDPPHTGANYVMREMGYQVARKHAMQLRRIVTALLFVLPSLLSLLMLVANGEVRSVLAVAAVGAAAIGVAVERWLFFAEAEHVSMLFYGREAA